MIRVDVDGRNRATIVIKIQTQTKSSLYIGLPIAWVEEEGIALEPTEASSKRPLAPYIVGMFEEAQVFLLLVGLSVCDHLPPEQSS